MRAWAALAAIVLAACRGGINHSTALRDLDLADRYERGDGVQRDYRRAAELLAESCDKGRGLSAACRRMALARRAARGVPRASGDAELRQACRAGDWIACAYHDPIDTGRADAACDRGDAEACYAFSRSPTRDDEDSDPASDARMGALAQACQGGVLVACEELVGGGTDETARTRVKRACRTGDADACAALETPIDAAILCAAHDYVACLHRGYTGDAVALAAACDDGNVAEACEGVAVLARDAETPPPNLLALMERACRAGAKQACGQRADELASGCAAYRVDVFAPGVRRPPLAISGTDAHGAPWRATAGPMVTVPPGLLSGEGFDATASRAGISLIAVHRAQYGRHDIGRTPALSVIVDDALAMTSVTGAGYHPGPLALISAIVIFDRDLVPVAALWPNAGHSPPGFAPPSLARCLVHTLQQAVANRSP